MFSTLPNQHCMHKFKICCLLILLAISKNSYSQIDDLVRLDYTNIPPGKSDIQYSRIKGLFNFPIKLSNEKTYLFLGLDYSHLDLRMPDNPSFDNEEIDDFQILNLNIMYTRPIKNNWRLGFRLAPGVSSNLTAKALTFGDLVLSGDVVLIKDKTGDKTIKKPWRLIFGVSYSGDRGFPFPLPFLSYYRKLNSKWSYNFGIPKSNLQYHISQSHRLKLYAELDGFTSNMQKIIIVDGNKQAESINMSMILGGLQYEYYPLKHLEFYFRTSYIFSKALELRDKNKNKVLELDSSNSLYLRTGIAFKI